MPRFRPGDLVLIQHDPFSGVTNVPAVICEEPEDDLEPCWRCNDDGCVVWSNLEAEDGTHFFHVPECLLVKGVESDHEAE